MTAAGPAPGDSAAAPEPSFVGIESLIASNADYPSHAVLAVHCWRTNEAVRDVDQALSAADGIEKALDRINAAIFDRAEINRLRAENEHLRNELIRSGVEQVLSDKAALAEEMWADETRAELARARGIVEAATAYIQCLAAAVAAQPGDPAAALVPCCPRCLAPLSEVPDDLADLNVLGRCPTHGHVDSGNEVWQ